MFEVSTSAVSKSGSTVMLVISFVEEILVVVNIPGLNINELEDELIRTDYIDLLGRKVTLPKFGEIYLRTNYFKSGAVTKDKMYFLTK